MISYIFLGNRCVRVSHPSPKIKCRLTRTHRSEGVCTVDVLARVCANTCLGAVLDAGAAYHDPYPKSIRWYHQTATIEFETSNVQALDGHQFNRLMVDHQTVTIEPFQNGI